MKKVVLLLCLTTMSIKASELGYQGLKDPVGPMYRAPQTRTIEWENNSVMSDSDIFINLYGPGTVEVIPYRKRHAVPANVIGFSFSSKNDGELFDISAKNIWPISKDIKKYTFQCKTSPVEPFGFMICELEVEEVKPIAQPTQELPAPPAYSEE